MEKSDANCSVHHAPAKSRADTYACKFASKVKHTCTGKHFNYFSSQSQLLMYVCAIVCVVLVLSLTFCLGTRFQETSYNLKATSKKWDYLAFCQLWPPASCVSPELQKCTIPKNVTFWTIHGLWPSVFKGKWDPEFCNKTWKFNIHEIEPIRQKMDFYWPDCYDDDPVIDFWKHEWEKHGTCAANLSSLASQLKFFSKSLQLHDAYNLTTMMKEAGYTPNNETKIPVVELLNNLQKAVGNNVTIKCVNRKGTPTPLLQSIYICFDKNLTSIDCSYDDSNCHDDNVLYWPFPDVRRAGS